MRNQRVVGFLILVLSILLASQVIIRNTSNKNKDIFNLINVAGKQRMLSQSMLSHLLILKSVWNDSAGKSSVVLDLNAIESSFIRTNERMDSAFKLHGLMDVRYKELQSVTNELLEKLHECLNKDSLNAMTSALEDFKNCQKRYLLAMDVGVNVIQSHGEKLYDFNLDREFWFSLLSFFIIISAFLYAVFTQIKDIKRKNGLLQSYNRKLQVSERELKDSLAENQKLNIALKNTWKKYMVFIEQAPGAIAMFDKDMHYLVASRKWYSDYGLIGKEIIGKSHYEIFPEIGEDWKKIHRECLSGAINRNQESIFIREDGTEQWLSWDVRPWRDESGEIGGIIMYTDDISDIKQLSQEKEHLLEVLNKVSETASIGVWDFNIKKRKIFWDKSTRRIFGVGNDFEPRLSNFFTFFQSRESRLKILKALMAVLRHGQPFDLELKFINPKGEEQWIRTVGESELKDGSPVRLFGFIHDITNIKNQEHSITELLTEINAIMDSATEVSIISTDKTGVITHFSKGAEKLLQYKASEMIGLQTPVIFHAELEVLERSRILTEEYKRSISGFDTFITPALNGKPDTREWTYIKKDGTHIKVLLSVTTVVDEHGELYGFLGVATELTEINKLKEEIIERNKELEELTDKLSSQNLQLANFAHITSHNLRSPVINLNSLLYFYSTSDSEDEKHEIMLKFSKVIEHLTSTLESLVETLKIREEGNNELEFIEFEDVLQKTREICTAQIQESEATIVSDFNEVKGVYYRRDYMESIFLNMITNAIKYRSSERKLILKISSRRMDESKVLLSFADNGSGIDLSRHRGMLFGLNKTFHSNKDAKGVGLFITKTQVEALGGKINVDSEVEKGTTFKIEIPN